MLEGLIVAEKNKVYAYSIQICKLMVPHFQLHSIKIIFSDQLVTHTLLDNLGISNTCLLHGDRYHLLNKVFPEPFGMNNWNTIRNPNH